jgi:hypothetical protein
MKKQMILAAALASFGTVAVTSNADALFFDSLVSKAKSAVGNVINTVASKASSVVPGLGDKAQGLAQKALDVVKSTATGLVEKLGTAAQGLTGKAQQFLINRAEALAAKLPAALQPFAKKGIQLGAGGLTKLTGAINNAIAQAMQVSKNGIAKAHGISSAQLGQLKQMLVAKAQAQIELARKIARGRAERMVGQVANNLKGTGQALASKVGSWFKGRAPGRVSR